MDKLENSKYKSLSIVLIVAIVLVIIFGIVPKYSPTTADKIVEKIDFSDSLWMEQYIEKSVGIYGSDFFLSTAFSYNIRSNKMVVTYATQESVEKVREYYLALPGAELTGRNDETSLNVLAKVNGQDLRVYNYYSSISRVIELDLTLNPDHEEQVVSQLEAAFPEETLADMAGLEGVISGETFGGYVRYSYDDFDEFIYPYIPIFSRAYIFNGEEEDYEQIIALLDEAYPDHQYDQSQNTHYYKIDQQIISVTYFVTDSNEKIVSISIQTNRGD